MITNKILIKITQSYLTKQNNCLWIGNTQGLFNYNLSTRKIKQLNTALNFEPGTVFSIQKDANENLWFASDARIVEIKYSKRNH